MADDMTGRNGVVVNGIHDSSNKTGLKILIVGAGIGGCTAALGLRQQGHDVELFEQSRFSSELGAAISLAPNANGVLQKLGIFAESFGSNPLLRSWLLAHRVHLHEALKEAATGPLGTGKPAQLHTASPVVDVDVHTATVILKDGQRISGDVIVGADGVHSITRAKIPDGDVQPFGSGKSAFRFLLRRKSAQEDPACRHLVEDEGEFVIWKAVDRRVVMYPTANNEVLNLVCIHPEVESEASDDWNTGATADKLVHVFKSFDPALLALLRRADPETIRVWKLLDMPVIPQWTDDRLALLGDAAHPLLPYQGQGGAVAIEDAVSLAVVLSADTNVDEIPERLKLYESIRHTRASKIQEYSRLSGHDLNRVKKLDLWEYTNYIFGHDEWDNSTQRLREWKWSRMPEAPWRIPLAFGPVPGPGNFKNFRPRNNSTFTTASIRFKTSRTVLQNFFPPGPKRDRFRFKSPGTIAYASFSHTLQGKPDELGACSYGNVVLYIHGVEYVKEDGDVISGAYLPILFELPMAGEVSGMPRLSTEIDAHRRGNGYHVNMSWGGAIWSNFTWESLEEIDGSGDSEELVGGDDIGILAYKHIHSLRTGGNGKSELEYPIYVPFKDKSDSGEPRKVWKAAKASFDFDKMDQETLPTLHGVVERLQEIPVYEIIAGKVFECAGGPNFDLAWRIE